MKNLKLRQHSTNPQTNLSERGCYAGLCTQEELEERTRPKEALLHQCLVLYRTACTCTLHLGPPTLIRLSTNSEYCGISDLPENHNTQVVPRPN